MYELDFERGAIFLEMYPNQIGLDQMGVIGQFYPNGAIGSNSYTIAGRPGFEARGYGSIGNGRISYLACYQPDSQTRAILVIIGSENQQYFYEAASSLQVSVNYNVASAQERKNLMASNNLAQSRHWTDVVSHTGDYSYNEGNNLGPGYDEVPVLPGKLSNFA